MKKAIFLLSALLLSAGSYAQVFTIGPRVGISQSYLKVKDSALGDFKNPDPVVGFHAGVFARVKLASFYVQPELLFTSAGGKIEITNSQETVDQVLEYNYNRIDIPVMVGFKASAFRVNAGPVASFNINTKNKSAGEIGDEIKDKYRTATIGLQGGVGLDLWKFVIDLKYETGLSSMTKDVNINGTSYEFDQRAQQVLLSVGYKIL